MLKGVKFCIWVLLFFFGSCFSFLARLIFTADYVIPVKPENPMLLYDLATVSKQIKRDLNQSKVDSFVSRVAKNNDENNGDRHKIFTIFLTNWFVLVITLI